MIHIIKHVKHVFNILVQYLNVKDVVAIILARIASDIIGHINVVFVFHINSIINLIFIHRDKYGTY